MAFREAGGMSLQFILFSVIRFFQFALAITVCGLYGVDVHSGTRAGVRQDGRWVYAVVIGAFSAFTAVLYMVPFIMRIPFAFVWDCFLLFMWIVLFGIFGNLFIRENAEGDSGIQRMKNAVWVDLANMLLWLITAIIMAGYWWKNRNGRTTFTGRGKNHV